MILTTMMTLCILGNLVDPSKWMPMQFPLPKIGRYAEQMFLQPHFSMVDPISIDSVRNFTLPPHGRSFINNNTLVTYQATVDEVLYATANLTDRQKMIAEFFDDKFASLAMGAVFVILKNRQVKNN